MKGFCGLIAPKSLYNPFHAFAQNVKAVVEYGCVCYLVF